MIAERLATLVVERRRLAIVVVLLATVAVGAGATNIEQTTGLEDFQAESAERGAMDYVEANFTGGGDATPTQVVFEGENVLDRDGVLAVLRFEGELRADERVNGTLVDDRPFTSVANAVGTVAVRADRGPGRNDGATDGLAAEEVETGVSAGAAPSLDAQIEAVESMSDDEVERVVEEVLSRAGDGELLALLPAEYEPGESAATATVLVVEHDARGEFVSVDAAPDFVVDAQTAIQDAAADSEAATAVFGLGITTEEINRAATESLGVLGPLALIFVLVVLAIAYRDPIDVALGVLGLGVVLVWTFGAMGWAGIDFGMMFVAAPVLLIGLGVDYAIHVVMRYREARDEGDRDVADGMAVGLGSVGLALVYVTVSTTTGFLSFLSSPVGPIGEFGVVCAAGIGASLVVFGVLVPAVKVELDGALAARGIDRGRSAIGTGGRAGSLLGVGAGTALQAPMAVVLVLGLLSVGGAYAATDVEATFETAEFLPEDPPGWTEELPAALEPGDYRAKAAMETLDDRFVRQDRRVEILVRGDVTAPETLDRVADAREAIDEGSTVARLPNGDPAVRDPVAALTAVADGNPSVAATVEAADTDGDGVPDEDLEAVYETFAASDGGTAGTFLHAADGDYRALRLTYAVDSTATDERITAEARSIADRIDGESVAAVATGEQTVLFHQVERRIVDTVVESLVATVVVVTGFLALVYRRTAGSATLGILTVVPVVMALAWTIGTMALLGLSFNFITAMIASLTVGLGVDYSIHVSERFRQELDRRGSVPAAIGETVTGTGGAILGSAVTTAGGFGIIGFSFLPSLQVFGVVIALSIVYAFLASVLVLPSLLVLWGRASEGGVTREADPGASPGPTD